MQLRRQMFSPDFRVEEELSGISRQPQINVASPASQHVDQVHTDFNSDSNVISILVVEDNLISQKVLAKQLQNHGFKVVLANHGEEALAYIKTTNFCSPPFSPSRVLDKYCLSE